MPVTKDEEGINRGREITPAERRQLFELVTECSLGSVLLVLAGIINGLPVDAYQLDEGETDVLRAINNYL